MSKMENLLRSRKFWAAMTALIFMLIKAYKPDFPLDEAEITNLVTVLAAYILGTAIEDKALRGPRMP